MVDSKQDKIKVKKIRLPKSSVDTEELAQENLSLKGKDLPKPDPLPDYDKKFKPIHGYIVECDLEVEWPVLKAWIKRKPISLKDAMEMLAVQPDMAMRAKRVELLAKKELEHFNLDFKERIGILRDLALDYWEERKRGGMHKQITNEMIEDWIVENYGDTWTEMKGRVRDMKNTHRLLEQLTKQVIDRAPNLRKDMDMYATKKADPSWFAAQKHKRTRKG